jgi:rhodanese-related sulfurtransferase
MLSILKKLFGLKPAPDFIALLANGAVIVDVRSPEEYKQGHIKESLNYPLNIIQQQAAVLKKKKVPVITVCRSGARSAMGKRILSQAGIEAYNGGAWNQFNTAFYKNL